MLLLIGLNVILVIEEYAFLKSLLTLSQFVFKKAKEHWINFVGGRIK